MHVRMVAMLLIVSAFVVGCSRLDNGGTLDSARVAESPAKSVESSTKVTESPATVAESPLPYVHGCAAFHLSAHRCQAIVDALAARLKIKPSEATSIELLGDPGCGGSPGVPCIRSTSFVVRVRFHMADGRAPEDSVFCGVGGQYSILCTESPEIYVSADLMHEGYLDHPCAGEPPAGCASPVPTIDPAAAADARPLLVKAINIPLDRVGAYSVDLGNATLANGILTDASFTLADVHPTTWSTTEDGVRLVVESLDGGPPFLNSYDHGWRPGVERVVAKAVFEISATQPGAVMPIRDVAVR
jgi:hypothetical protein